MRILNLEEKNSLIGKEVDLNLPLEAGLYLKTGVSQIFYRVNTNNSANYSDWLYIPKDTLSEVKNIILEDEPTDKSDFVSRELFEIDSIYTYPIIMEGEIAGHIVTESKRENLIDVELNKRIIDFVKESRDKFNSNYDGLSEISSLASESGLDFNSFFKKFLKLLISGKENTCAGLYYYEEKNYKLRMIIGDLSRYDNFIGLISDDFSYTIKTEIDSGNNFIRLDSALDEVILSDEPIELYFVQRILKSDVGEYIVLIPLSGFENEEYVERLKQLTRLVSLVQFNRFNNETFMLENYKTIFNRNNEIISFSKFLKGVVNSISSFLPVRAVSFIGDDIGAYSVSLVDHNLIVYTDKTLFLNSFDIDYSQNQAIDINANSPFGTILNNVSLKFIGEKYSRFLPIQSSLENNYALSFSFEKEFENKKLLDLVMHQTQELISHYLNVKRNHKRMDISVVKSLFSNQNTKIVRRWSTISKLTSGYFHSLYSFISVIMGQSEIIEASLKNLKLEKEQQLLRSLNKIQSASDQLSHSLELFKRICPDDNIMPDEKMSCKSLIKSYPEIFGEYLNSIEAKKRLKISFSISTSNSIDYDLSYENVFDVTIPLTVLLLDYAVSNSRIELTLSNSGGFDNLNYQFRSAMLGSVSIKQILNKIFPDYNHIDLDENRGKVEVGDLVIFYEERQNDHSKIIIKKKSIFFKDLL